MTFLIIFLVALAVSAVGFHRYIWFISIGYGFSIAAIGTALLIMFGVRHELTAAAALDKDQLHAILPVQCHLREVPRDGAGIDVKWKTHGTVLLCFLQKRWISHVCFLLMIGLYHNLHCLGKILHVLCGIS